MSGSDSQSRQDAGAAEGAADPVGGDHPALIRADALADNGRWTHVDVTGARPEETILAAAPGLSHSTLAALTDEDTRPRVDSADGGLLLILRGANLAPGAPVEDMISLRLWCDGRHLISCQRRPVRAVERVRDRLIGPDSPASAGAVLAALVQVIVQHMTPFVDAMLEQVDDLEDTLLGTPDKSMYHGMMRLRSSVLTYRRYLRPQRDALNTLQYDPPGFLSAERGRLRETANTLIRHLEDLDTAREALQMQQEELMTMLSARMNETLYRFSVVATIFLPLGFLTGLMGVNVAGMPGTVHPDAFWWLSGSLVLFGLGLYAWFRRKGLM
ncbi:zinc transporter ZntB [Yunchengibacter salinarum]|uniref:zinc transporter ZntB n=1 Tax=Yunchengibacter salinarum TaxID=3133399 RepID=UPI0035B5C931